MKQEFPWLGSGFVHAVADEHVPMFTKALHDLGFSSTVVEGSAVVDDRTFWAEIRRAFDFPDYFGANWDAFNDCFGDLDLPPRLAVIWRRSDLTSAVSLKLLVEGVALLVQTAEAIQPLGTQLVVALTGEGSGFAQPSA